jgi:Ca2+-binding EF-hand superfamily protein
LDLNRSACIDFYEFREFFCSWSQDKSLKRLVSLKLIAKSLDVQKISTQAYFEEEKKFEINRRLSIAEFTKVVEELLKLPAEVAVNIFKELDTDQDGFVTINMFSELINQYRGPKKPDVFDKFQKGFAKTFQGEEIENLTNHGSENEQDRLSRIDALVKKIESVGDPRASLSELFSNLLFYYFLNSGNFMASYYKNFRALPVEI